MDRWSAGGLATGPAATRHGQPWTDADDPTGECHVPAALAACCRRANATGSPSLAGGSLRPPFPSGRSRAIIPARWAAAWRAPPSSAASRSSRPSRPPGGGPQMPNRPSSWSGGEAGVGKTRLVTELTARCIADGTQVLAGGCVPVGDGALPYAPIVEALRALLADLGVSAVRELVGPSWPELARLLPALGAAPEVGPAGQAAQARLFELLLGLLERLGEQASLVLVVEDLHWSDQSTRDLLAFLVRNFRRERVLLVVTYRSDEAGQQRLGPYLAELDRGGRVDRIELPRFQRREVAAQLTGILGAAPAADLVDATFARS